MKINELSGYLEQTLQYPVDRVTVIEQVGAVGLDAPDDAQNTDIRAVLEPLNEERYDSADDLFTSILGGLGDAYIGRKFYDDRGANPPRLVGGDRFPENESF